MGGRVLDSLKGLKKLRPKVSRASLMTFSAMLLILFVAFIIRLLPMRWEIQKGSVHLSEFDPYFHYRFTEHIVKNGFVAWAWPEPWVDEQRWYPYGMPVAKTGFPGLSLTAAFLYKAVTALGFDVKLMDLCALFPAVMGALASLIIYFLGKDIGGKPVGLLAALFLALNPSYVQRTSLGFFDDETVGITAFLLFILLFLRAIDEGRRLSSAVKYSLASGAALGYFCSSWGAAFYPIGATTLFVALLVLTGRYTRQLLLCYSSTFGLGLFLAINVPKNSLGYLTTGAVMPVAGVFILLCLMEVLRNLTSIKWKAVSFIVFLATMVGGLVILWQGGHIGGIAGKFISVLNPFVRAGSPLVESVAEHRISAWASMYFDLGIGIIFFIAGLFFTLGNPNNRNLFLLLLGLTSLYFACSMVRLLVLMAPAFSLLAAVGAVGLLKPFVTLLKEPLKPGVMKKKYGLERVGKEFSGTAIFLIFLVLMMNVAFPMPRAYRQAYSPITISAGSLPIAPNEPVREWLDMLEYTRQLGAETVVCSWWDYGYWLTILGNVTTLVDNATINTTQIQNVGFIFMSDEGRSLKMLKAYDVEYILVFTTIDAEGKWVGWGDEGKWMWMADISGQRYNWTRFDFGNYTEKGWEWNERGVNSVIYRLMNYARERWLEEHKGGTRPAELTYFKEAYIAGLALSPDDAKKKYGGVIPLVCLYKIDYGGR